MMNNGKIIVNRMYYFAILLFLIQIIHLILFTTAPTSSVMLTSLLLYSFIFLNFFIIKKSSMTLSLFNINANKLLFFLVLGTLGKLISRYDYIQEWLQGGLTLSRNSEIAGKGGWYSYLSILFYPATILYFFANKEVLQKKIYLLCNVTIIAFLLIDFIFVGTRNVPIFIILIYLLTRKKQYKFNGKTFLTLFLLIIGFLIIFDYTTTTRLNGIFSWQIHLQNTISTQVVGINETTLKFLNHYASFLYPLIFLTHYLAHSIGELVYLLSHEYSFGSNGPIYLISEFCTAGLCDKGYYNDLILSENIRAGVYQTIFGSLFYDFGISIGILIFILIFSFNSLSIILSKKIGVINFMLLIILILSPIENYLYGGMGLIQIVMTYIIYLISITKIKSNG